MRKEENIDGIRIRNIYIYISSNNVNWVLDDKEQVSNIKKHILITDECCILSVQWD